MAKQTETKLPNNLVLTEVQRMVLKERIYPAIRACVANRSKILAGVFVYYGFIFSLPEFQARIDRSLNLVVSLAFSLLLGHNLLNYWTNSSDQKKFEGEGKPIMEVLFFGFSLGLVWGAHWLLFCKVTP